MKKSIIKYTGAISLVATLATGCTKDFKDLNTNPVTVSADQFNPNYLLTSAQLAYTGSFDFSYETWRNNLIYCSTMMQQLSTVIGYWAGDKYLLTPWYTSAYWERAYAEQVKPIVDMIELTKNKPEYNNVHQAGRIMRALILQRITDLYGDVPYFDAGMGYYTQQYFPAYDNQQAIYDDILKELEEASNALNPAGDVITGDAFFAGKTNQVEKWKRFGFSMLLRAGMRLSKVDPAKAQAIVAKTIGKTMQSNDDNAFLVHDANGGRPTVNRNAQVLNGSPENDYVKWSKKTIDFLKTNNDPRLGVIAQVAGDMSAAKQKGMPNGYDLSGVAGRDISSAPGYTSMADYSKPSQMFLSMSAPTFIFTYAESELLLADAASRWNITGIGSAESHYNNGVRASMTYLRTYSASAVISETAITDYLTAHPFNSANALDMINTQYWVLTSTMFDFYEGWSNWRRSGFPALTPVNYPGNATQGTIPRRFPYPVAEANTNPDNYSKASGAVPGGDVLSGRVWWDKQ